MLEQDPKLFPTDKESHFLLAAPGGVLEVKTHYPKQYQGACVVLGHPHPLQEGTMDNKVVHTLARAYVQQNFAVVRFNFRGVGQSSGTWGDVHGECDDFKTVVQWLQGALTYSRLDFAGFSFGSYISAFQAQNFDIHQLISIAPPVHHNDFQALSLDCKWLIVQGEEDEVVAAHLVQEFAERDSVHAELILFPETTHFFHGQLVKLKNLIIEHIEQG